MTIYLPKKRLHASLRPALAYICPPYDPGGTRIPPWHEASGVSPLPRQVVLGPRALVLPPSTAPCPALQWWVVGSRDPHFALVPCPSPSPTRGVGPRRGGATEGSVRLFIKPEPGNLAALDRFCSEDPGRGDEPFPPIHPTAHPVVLRTPRLSPHPSSH